MIGDSGLQALTLQQMLDRFAELAAAEVILGNYKFDAAVQIKERAASATFTAAYGQLWIKSASPSELWYADDAGAESQVMIGAAGPVAEVNDLSSVVTWANVPQANIPDPLLQANGTAGAPSYSFASAPTDGFYSGGTQRILIATDGAELARFSSTGTPHGLQFAGTGKPLLYNVLSTATQPTLVAYGSDPNTGIGGTSPDRLSLIAGGIEGLAVREVLNGIQFSPAADIAITALAGGGSGGAGILKQSYNLITVAASTGDSVTLPVSFLVNTLIHIVNAGANAVDVFPGSGDDLGAGADTAVSLPAGDGITYIGTVLNTTWAPYTMAAASAPHPDPHLLGDGSAAAPTYSFSGETGTGLYRNAGGNLAIVKNGVEKFEFASSGNFFQGLATGSPAMANENASATNPVFIPDSGDFDTGIGTNAADQLSLIAGGVEMLRLTESTVDQVIIAPGVFAGTSALPSLAFNDGTSGFYLPFDSQLRVCVGGAERFDFKIASAAGVFSGVTGGGPRLIDIASTNLIPVHVFSNDPDTGLGRSGVDALSLTAGGKEMMRLVETGTATTDQVIIGPAGIIGDAVTPALAFGDGNTGFFESGDNSLRVATAGIDRYTFSNNGFFNGSTADTVALRNTLASATVPNIIPNSGDSNTGIGHAADDTLTLIAGAIEGLSLKELNSGVVQAPAADLSITAFSGGGQGSAVALIQSYNVLAVVAAGGDSVALPAVFAVNSIIHIHNDTANSADVFPASGDDLGQGADTAEALAAGGFIAYIATVANSTWEVWIPVASTADPILLADNSAAAPAYSFVDDPATGFYMPGDNLIGLAAGGVAKFFYQADVWHGAIATAGGISNVAATDTVPTLHNKRNDLNTGFGGLTADEISAICSGTEVMTWKVGAVDIIGLLGVSDGTEGAPTLSFTSDPDTGFYQNADNVIGVTVGGDVRYKFADAVFGGNFEGFEMLATDGSITSPVYRFAADINTGLGRNTDVLSLIAGGVAGLQLRELNTGVLQIPDAELTITAFATGGQSSAVALKTSYTVVSVCATDGDSVKLPPIFTVNSIMHIKNGGAKSLDVFPASGDDLGQGTDTAEALASGRSTSYICTTTDATWTNMRPLLTTTADPLLLGDGSAAAPTFAFTNDVDTGLFYLSNQLVVATEGVQRYSFNDVSLVGFVTNAGALLNETASATNPTNVPAKSDMDTGLGWGGGDILSVIAGGIECLKFTELASGVIQAPSAALAITAFAGGGNTSAVVLVNSYSRISVCATTGDSVKMPLVFAVNSIIKIRNDGAETADVFPGVGDDIGAGTDTAVALVAGASITYIALTANALWTAFE